MAEFLEVMNEFKRMCDSYQCPECPLHKSLPTPLFCRDKLAQEPEKLEMIIMTWAKHHPRKTMEDVLFEKFPQAQRLPNGRIRICPHMLNPAWANDQCVHEESNCRECWRRPVEE